MRNRFLAVVFIPFLWGSSIAHAELRAGVAKVDITPKTHEPLAGPGDRTATGTLDPLYARILVLEAGRKQIALVTLDLLRTFGEPSLDHLKEVVSKSSGISCLLLTASHTHATPVSKDEYKGAPPEWEQRAFDEIAAGIKTASDNLKDARIGSGTGSVSRAGSTSRRHGRWQWRNNSI